MQTAQLTKHRVMKTWQSEGSAPPFLTSELQGGEWSGSRPGCFNLEETAPVIHSIGGWLGPGASLDTAAKTKKLLPCRESNPGRQDVARPYAEWAIPAHGMVY
jgi:hypothetical protein